MLITFVIVSITGSIISSTILYPRVENGTLEVPEDWLQHCGINDCPDLNLTAIDFLNPSESTVSDLYHFDIYTFTY